MKIQNTGSLKRQSASEYLMEVVKKARPEKPEIDFQAILDSEMEKLKNEQR